MLIKSVLLQHVRGLPSTDKYEFLSKVYNQDSFCLLCTDCVGPLVISRLHAYRMRGWLKWVNENIILHIGDITMSEKRLGVLIRIAVNMLDKVSSVDDITRIEMCSNLQHNVWDEYYNIRSEGLPF